MPPHLERRMGFPGAASPTSPLPPSVSPHPSGLPKARMQPPNRDGADAARIADAGRHIAAQAQPGPLSILDTRLPFGHPFTRVGNTEYGTLGGLRGSSGELLRTFARCSSFGAPTPDSGFSEPPPLDPGRPNASLANQIPNSEDGLPKPPILEPEPVCHGPQFIHLKKDHQ